MNIYFFNDFSGIDSDLTEKIISTLPAQRREYNYRLKTKKGKLFNALSFFLLKYALIKDKNIILDKNEKFVFGLKGKPCLRGKEVDFSVSHSDAGIVCAVCGGMNTVGVDIEAVRDYKDKVAERVCCREELKLLHKTADFEKKAELFYEMWVKKEAFSKMTGNGFSEGFERINTLVTEYCEAKLFSLKNEKSFIGLSVRKNEILNETTEVIKVSADSLIGIIL